MAAESPRRGAIASWSPEKAFGFIASDRGGRHLFFHDSAVCDPTLLLVPDIEVVYEIELDERGRPRATNVRGPDYRDSGPVAVEGFVESWRGTHGLILDAVTGRRFFCHFNDIEGTGYRALREGQRVSFSVVRLSDKQGRQRFEARKVRPLEDNEIEEE